MNDASGVAVVIVEGQLRNQDTTRVGTALLAKGFKKKHKFVKALVEKHKEMLSQGTSLKRTATIQNNQDSFEYLLTELQATYLMKPLPFRRRI